MRHILLMIAVVMGQCVLAADKKPLTKEESAKFIEAAIRKSIKKPTGELTKADLAKVKFLSLGYNQLTDVPKGLEKLTQLTELRLDGNKLTDVKGLEKLTKLTGLELNENRLTDVKGLEKLDQLTWLNLWGNQLASVKGLEKLTQLKGLWLQDNPDLTKAQIEQLQKTLPKCKIYSNPPLTAEESAKVIEAAIRKAAKKPTGELTKADLEKVTELQLQNNKLTDVSGLENLTQLRELYLHYNKLSDVKGLEKLTQLRTLVLDSNPDLTKAQIAELKKTLPNCRISNNAKK